MGLTHYISWREDGLSKSTQITLCVVHSDLNLFLCSNLANCINVLLFTPSSPSVSVIETMMLLCCTPAGQSEIRARTLRPNTIFPSSYRTEIEKAMIIYSGGVLTQFQI